MKSEENGRRFPGEWEKHESWLGWPHYQADWPGYFNSIELDVAEVVRLLSQHERVNIICKDEVAKRRARKVCRDFHAELKNCRFYTLRTNRSWLRDSGPTAVSVDGKLRWIRWTFKGWGGSYPNYHLDQKVPKAIAEWSGLPLEPACWPDGEPVEMEGGAIETNGGGILITTEECLLGGPHWRNKGRSKKEYERMFRTYLGVREILWLGRGFTPDQTQGHIDNVARFVAPYALLLATPHDPADPNYGIWRDNLRRIKLFNRRGQISITTYPLPYPKELVMRCGERLPAGYINLYIGTGTVIVPVFNDEHDREALSILGKIFDDRRVVGRYSRNMAWGYGGDHCLLQQQPV